MHFLRCPSCGAKALASASRCPRCTTPFDLIDGRGERMKLYPCRSCNVLLPENVQVCPWCKAERRSGPPAWLLGAAALLLVGIGVGWWKWRASDVAPPQVAVAPIAQPESPALPTPPLDSLVADTTTGATVDSATMRVDGALVAPATTPPATLQAPTAPVAAPRSTAQQSVPQAEPQAVPQAVVSSATAAARPSPPPPPQPSLPPARAPLAQAVALPAANDAWHRATPLTWINVRSAARPDAPIVRVVRPDEAVQVGRTVAGWRAVRGTDYSGWAGARHFREEGR